MHPANPAQGPRLDSWKAIAAHLGRNVRTATRWAEERGMPVHRVPGGKRQAVFAYAQEIDAWLTSRRDNNHGDTGDAVTQGRAAVCFTDASQSKTAGRTRATP